MFHIIGRKIRVAYLRQVAAEIERVSRFSDQLIQILPTSTDDQCLLDMLRPQNGRVCPSLENLEVGAAGVSRIILINGTLNHDFDAEGLLTQIKSRLVRSDRVIVVGYNPYRRWLFELASWIGWRKGATPSTFFTRSSLTSVAKLAGFEVVRIRPVVAIPSSFFGLVATINRFLAAIPGLRWFGLVSVAILRPVCAESGRPSLSIVVPARNEFGNIEPLVNRIPNDLGCMLELIFVEGNSTDNTLGEIERVAAKYQSFRKDLTIRVLKQTGKGKNDAVRLGFTEATGELLTILDADMTMPPELLGRFYFAYVRGLGDFINGSRLVYPMEGQAMKFLNHIGNVFFAKVLSFVLEVSISDSLCGTKLLSRRDYQRVVEWRKVFGDIDPFGDFELIFPAAQLGLGIVDVPIRYRDRTYGTTNIRRFYHGAILLKMSMAGLLKIRIPSAAK